LVLQSAAFFNTSSLHCNDSADNERLMISYFLLFVGNDLVADPARVQWFLTFFLPRQFSVIVLCFNPPLTLNKL